MAISHQRIHEEAVNHFLDTYILYPSHFHSVSRLKNPPLQFSWASAYWLFHCIGATSYWSYYHKRFVEATPGIGGDQLFHPQQLHHSHRHGSLGQIFSYYISESMLVGRYKLTCTV